MEDNFNFNNNNENTTNESNTNENNFIDAVETAQGTYTEKRKARKHSGVAKKAGIFILCGTLFGATAGGAFTGITYLLPQKKNTVLSTTTVPAVSLTTSKDDGIKASTTGTTSTSGAMSVADISKNCMPSIVAITNVGVTDVMTFWGKMQQQSESCGSGVIIGKTDKELLIVTNNHVVAGTKNLTVVFSYDEESDKPNAVEAYVKGTDEDKDLAVIAISIDKLTKDELNKISIATIGSSKDLILGQQVVAIGNALGYGQSVTTGIVSALNRTISNKSSQQEAATSQDSNKYIQTDAAINPGNSGGALFNMKGELVGINSAKIALDTVEGMGYAIPISDVYDLIEQLMNETTRTDVVKDKDRGYLGISGTDVSSQVSAAYGIPEGVYVSKIVTNSAADKAGVKKGYVITKFDGKRVSSIASLQNMLTYYKAGETVSMTIQVPNDSEYKEKELKVTLSTAKEADITTSDSSKNNNQNNSQNGNDGSNGFSNGDDGGFFDFGDFFGR